MSVLKCPTCGNPFDSATTTAMPFCSPRCRQIDLGRWLNEEQRLPHVRDLEDEEEADPSAAQNGHDSDD
jgi:uncharacterized protein